jgi:hypothetical protein
VKIESWAKLIKNLSTCTQTSYCAFKAVRYLHGRPFKCYEILSYGRLRRFVGLFQPGVKALCDRQKQLDAWDERLVVVLWIPMTSVELTVRERGVFQVGNRTITIDDVICAAHFRGELEKSWQCVCEYAQSGTIGREIEEAALQARSEEFRISRDLISAEETEHWLDERGLSLDDFSDFLIRQELSALASVSADRQVEEYAFAPADLRELLRIDLLFTGDFDRLATALAWRIAAREAENDSLPASEIESERTRFSERSGLQGDRLENWLLGLGRDVVWLNEMLEFEALYRAQREALLSVGSRERMLHALRMPLMRFDLELIEVDSRDAAHEVFECVSADGEPMEEVASDAGYPYRRSHVFYEDLPEDLQPRLLSAKPGEILNPIERDGRFELCRLVGKTELDLTDDEVRHRVEEKIVERHFSELAARFVRWILPPTATP